VTFFEDEIKRKKILVNSGTLVSHQEMEELLAGATEEEEFQATRTRQREKMEECITKLSDGERQALKEEFRLFDKDKSGYITKKELLSVLRDLGVYRTTEAEELGAEAMLSVCDSTDDERIDEHEFLGMMALQMKLPMGETDLRSAFAAFDADGSGSVSSAELKDALCKLGNKFLSEEECDELMSLADFDHDGTLNVTEFVNIFMGDDLGRPLTRRCNSLRRRRSAAAASTRATEARDSAPLAWSAESAEMTEVWL